MPSGASFWSCLSVRAIVRPVGGAVNCSRGQGEPRENRGFGAEGGASEADPHPPRAFGRPQFFRGEAPFGPHPEREALRPKRGRERGPFRIEQNPAIGARN